MTRSEIRDLIARVQDAGRRRDSTELANFYAEDCVVESPVAGGEARGRTAIASSYEAFFHAFPDLETKYDEPIIDGERVVLIARISGTDHGGFMGMHPTGRFVDFPCVLVFALSNGEIVHERRIYDFTGLAVQVGAIKAKPV
ncbi:MAG TPA: SgcJ/EcaC family oxidoreductase [Vicinamibacterales bacterium]|jgi:steroid delta-isomerase-like uncharacterized protein|nr:SgcJ/EcaC family oxidoreductase [Vicinamibacterales bacterium]